MIEEGLEQIAPQGVAGGRGNASGGVAPQSVVGGRGCAVCMQERAPRNWRPLVDALSDVGKLVHLAMRRDVVWEERYAEILFRANRTAYEMTLEEEARSWGCSPGRVMLREGPEMKAIKDRSTESAKTIGNTYNYDLAVAIERIREDNPRANRYVYASRLRVWEQARDQWKRQQITVAETFWAVNQAKADFYKHNVLGERAEVAPTNTVCEECKGYVARNPYRSMEELYRQCNLPAHINCPHYGRAVTDKKLSKDECRMLWLG